MGGRPFLRREAQAGGWSRADMAALTSSGALRQPLHGVLVDSRVPDSLELRAACLSLVLPPGAAVCRRTAAWLYGFDCRAPGEHLMIPDVECVVPSPGAPIRRPGVRGYEAVLPEHDLCVVDGVVCTTPLRTALDLARFLPRHMGLAAIDAMAAAGMVLPAEMAVEIERWRGERGVDRARRLIAICEPKTESFGESWTRLRLVDAGFPAPEAQINLPDDDHPRWRIDLGYRKQRAGVEYDGERYHASNEQRRHDEQRRLDCHRSFGWTVHGYTKAHILGPRMDLEYAVGELLSMTPRFPRRLW